MKSSFKKLAALISASLSQYAYSSNEITHEEYDLLKDESEGEVSVRVLNESVSKYLAAHRSHSSHRSHRSHRSSSSGNYRSTPSVPSPPPAAPPAAKPKQPPVKKSQPLSQQPRLEGSYPKNNLKTEENVVNNKKLRKNIIMRVQLLLQFEGYYSDSIDGIIGPNTRNAIRAYKVNKGLAGNALLDAETLNSMGIRGF